MSVFTWQALDVSGRRKRGEIESDSERSARKQLKQQGLIVQQLKVQEGHKKVGVDSRKKALMVLKPPCFSSSYRP